MASTEERAKAANDVLIEHFNKLLLRKSQIEEIINENTLLLEEINKKIKVWED